MKITGGCVPGNCGGSLISRRIVASAYHCTVDKKITKMEPCDHSRGDRVAIIGSSYIHGHIDHYDTVPIVNVLFPEGAPYDLKDITSHDFALLVLKESVTFGEKGKN